MKVLYVSPYPPAPDGIGTYTKMLAQAMRKRGDEVRVIIPRPTPDTAPEVMGTIGVTGRRLHELEVNVSQWNPDIIHVQFAVAAFGTRTIPLMRWLDRLSHNLKIPVVVTLHELTRETALLRSIGFWIYRWITTNSQSVIVHTDVAYSTLTGKVGVAKTKAVVIPHPVSAPPKETTTPEDLRARFALDNTRVLLVFGFIHVDKGLDDLIRGLSILRASANTSLDGIRVVIAGSVRPRNGVFRALEARDRLHLARVLRLAKRNKLQDLLLLAGYVPDSDVAAWFRIAEAVILPYKRAEQSGVASLATTFGVPVLASTVGGLAEQIPGSPWSFPPRAPDQIAVTLANFLHTLPAEQQVLNVSVRPSDLTSVVTATSELYNVAAGRR